MDQQSLLSVINHFQRSPLLPSNPVHPFGNSIETATAISTLKDLISAGDQLTHALTLYGITSLTNTKLCPSLREQCQITHSLHLSAQNRAFSLDSLRPKETVYGEDIPLDSSALPNWCVTRFEHWGSSAGLEAFRDDESKPGMIVLIFGGRVLVLDVEFVKSDSQGRFVLDHVKVSYAVNNESYDASPSLDAFLSQSFTTFVQEVTKLPEDMDPVKAAEVGKEIQGHLKYLAMLDKLASKPSESGGGIKWFLHTDELVEKLAQFSREEATESVKSLGLPRAPLDTFLRRSHGLPIPYLVAPSLSFLFFISPSAYLGLLKKMKPSDTSSSNGDLDVPLSLLRDHCRSVAGCQYASLILSPTPGTTFNIAMTGGARPTFPLSSEFEAYTKTHTFPFVLSHLQSPVTNSIDILAEKATENCWLLDFTNGGRTSGVVMSRSRMRDIQVVVNPLSEHSPSPVHHGASNNGIAVPSWVDLLLRPDSVVAAGYSTTYTSPSDAHPPLRIHLLTPSEPGFVLEKVPVRSLKETCAVIEIVREQCWLNSTLESVIWKPDLLNLPMENESQGDDVVAEEDLLAALYGRMKVDHIPINISFPPPPPPEPPFDTSAPIDDITNLELTPPVAHKPQVILTSPEKPPLSGMLQIVVTFDETRPRGVRVEMNRMMMMDNDNTVSLETMEEIVRRGGILSLVGRLFGRTKM